MKTTTIHRLLEKGSRYDLMFNSAKATDNGNKISIQGKSIEDSAFLYECLYEYLYENDIPFKVATWNRFALINTNKEQSHKAMTIYCIDGFDFNQLCEDIYSMTLDYKGWSDIKTPTSYNHYAGGLFTRNDRNENGVYIPAK